MFSHRRNIKTPKFKRYAERFRDHFTSHHKMRCARLALREFGFWSLVRVIRLLSLVAFHTFLRCVFWSTGVFGPAICASVDESPSIHHAYSCMALALTVLNGATRFLHVHARWSCGCRPNHLASTDRRYNNRFRLECALFLFILLLFSLFQCFCGLLSRLTHSSLTLCLCYLFNSAPSRRYWFNTHEQCLLLFHCRTLCSVSVVRAKF